MWFRIRVFACWPQSRFPVLEYNCGCDYIPFIEFQGERIYGSPTSIDRSLYPFWKFRLRFFSHRFDRHWITQVLPGSVAYFGPFLSAFVCLFVTHHRGQVQEELGDSGLAKQTGVFTVLRNLKAVLAITVALTILAVALSGCSLVRGWNGDTNRSRRQASFGTLNASDPNEVSMTAGQTMDLSYSVTLNKGTLIITVLDPDGNVVFNTEFYRSDRGGTQIVAETSGTYKVVATGREAGGKYDIRWNVK